MVLLIKILLMLSLQSTITEARSLKIWRSFLLNRRLYGGFNEQIKSGLESDVKKIVKPNITSEC